MPVTGAFAFDGIGTRWEIATDQPLEPRLRSLVVDRVEEFDRTWSRFRADSPITRLATDGGSATFAPEARDLFTLYDQLFAATNGAVDPLVGRDLELLGYDAHYTLRPAAPEVIDSHRERGRRRWDEHVLRDDLTVTVDGPTLIDVGAAGKGLLIDILSELLAREGIEDSLVDGSGDMRQCGDHQVRVGLEHPHDPSRVVGVIELHDGAALCASSITRRAWGPGLHHVLDGRTGQPISDIVATWAIAADALTADGIATALFSTTASRLAESFDFTSVRMHADGHLETWGELPGEVFA
jgi:thiamine biosynthesis lipoprotein